MRVKRGVGRCLSPLRSSRRGPAAQVTALLGPNGAGKSTAIGVLTGVVPLDSATDGDATVFGRSVRSDLAAVRARSGVCPQHDLLYEVSGLCLPSRVESSRSLQSLARDERCCLARRSAQEQRGGRLKSNASGSLFLVLSSRAYDDPIQ